MHRQNKATCSTHALHKEVRGKQGGRGHFCQSLVRPICYLLLLACRSRQASIVLKRYFRFEFFLLSILCMLTARMEMGTSRVSGDSDIIT